MWSSRATGRTFESFGTAQGATLSGRRRVNRAERAERGFSIIELMVVLTLLSFFFGAVYDTVIVGLRSVGSADTREDLRMQLTRALDRFTREVRMARNVTFAQDQQFQFDADFNADGNSTDPGEATINYQVSGTHLNRSQGGGSPVAVISNLSISSPLDFNYYEQGSTTESATCDSTSSCGSNCCRSEVRVVVITTTVTRGNETISMTSSAFLGNM